MTPLTDFVIQAYLGTNTGKAILQSPKVYMDYPVCFQFQYNISNQKAQLHLLVTTPSDDRFRTIQTWSYENQTDQVGWSLVQIPLNQGLTQIQLVAEKIGFSADLEFVLLNQTFIVNGSCPSSGELHQTINSSS